ncbi:MAG: 50S ribosome-binding GTPase [Planctomycetes bacterium]|nr:50S ribosome-binding GTPase [Planctomycetota bacterium]
MTAAHFVWCTPPEPAAIAVVRVSGQTIPARLFDRAPPAIGHACVARLRRPDGGETDEIVLTRLGDAVLELSTHGGHGVRAAVDACLRSHGLTAGDPTDADAAAGLVEDTWLALSRAASPAAARWLMQNGLAEPPFPRAFLARAPVVLITGPVNAGKSTLLNCWCGRERALVSDVPGTTRDLVAAETLIRGWRVRLIDSAGLRATTDALEVAGQDLAAAARAWADAVVYLDPPQAPTVPAATSRGHDIVVTAKADLRPAPIGGALSWSHAGAHGSTSAELLDHLGRAVLGHLGLPDLPG